LYGNWKYWSNLRTLTTVTLYIFIFIGWSSSKPAQSLYGFLHQKKKNFETALLGGTSLSEYRNEFYIFQVKATGNSVTILKHHVMKAYGGDKA
jgi:hypothetical protein